MRKKILHRRERKQKRKAIITLAIILLLGITSGYAYFNTNITLKAKGNIYNISDTCFEIEDNGDGTCTITDYDKTCGTDVVIPETIKGMTVTRIGDTDWNVSKVFHNKGLTSVIIPDTVTYIGKSAFSGNKLKTIDFPTNLETIGYQAFSANNLAELTFPVSLKKLDTEAFRDNSLITIPDLTNITYFGKGIFTCNAVVGEEAFIYRINENRTVNNTILDSYAGNCSVTEFTLPSNIKTIGGLSLRTLSIDTLNLPEGIEYLEKQSLMQVRISTINIPSSIKEIADDALNEATAVKIINIDRKENTIDGAPWGATNATVNWTGSN